MVDIASAPAPQAAAPGVPSPTVNAAPPAAIDKRSATLAAMAALRNGTSPPAAAAPVAPPAVPAIADPAPADPETPVAARPDPAPPAPATEEPPGMAAVRKAEQHARRQIAEERSRQQAEFDAQKIAWQAKLDKATALEQRLENARRDPIGLLKAAGFTDDDLEPLGRTLYGASPAGQKDPRYKASGEADLRARAESERVQRLETELRDLKGSLTKRDEQAQIQAHLDQFADGVVKAVGDTTPIARAALSKNPARVRAALLEVADRLYTDSGPSHDLRDVPTPAQVLAAYEADRRAELEMYGIDPAVIGRGHAPAAAPAPAPAPPAATIAPSGSSAGLAPRPSPLPSREEQLAALAKLRAG